MNIINVTQNLTMFSTFLGGVLIPKGRYAKELTKNHKLNYLNNFSLRMNHTDSFKNITTIVKNEECQSDYEEEKENYDTA